ncbi:hypothetical protein ETD86_37085 [Nonomuraea turkmeniaca]|uniref:Uncharacterized protein n=1 Tax=Nonomuraea turkmeniaca TaxID=103838 RepID=A0A5S4F4G7_9ACTN|nr:hypothetical protein [Nonomuraea turkmeniaca]TMR11061.1 hypothetical protein ETD86_37085 [Nonomuraea turkmeniaca]
MTADQMFDVTHSTPRFTPDTIQHLKDVRQHALGKAEKAMHAHQEWLSRATQWDDLIRRAEAYAEQPEQSWSHNDVGGEDGTSVLPQLESEPVS